MNLFRWLCSLFSPRMPPALERAFWGEEPSFSVTEEIVDGKRIVTFGPKENCPCDMRSKDVQPKTTGPTG